MPLKESSVPEVQTLSGPANMADGARTGQVLTTKAPAPGAGWP